MNRSSQKHTQRGWELREEAIEARTWKQWTQERRMSLYQPHLPSNISFISPFLVGSPLAPGSKSSSQWFHLDQLHLCRFGLSPVLLLHAHVSSHKPLTSPQPLPSDTKGHVSRRWIPKSSWVILRTPHTCLLQHPSPGMTVFWLPFCLCRYTVSHQTRAVSYSFLIPRAPHKDLNVE